MSRSIQWTIRMIALAWCSSLLAGADGLETAGVEYVTVPDEIRLDGRVEAVNQATVAAQTSGRVTEINFDIDDFVPKGEILVRLHDTELQARLTKAKSGLQEVQARFDKAADDQRRKQTLYREQAVSKSVLDAATAEFKAAQASLNAARAQLTEAGEQLEHTLIRAPYSGIVVERHIEPGELVQPGTLLMTGLSLDSLRVTTQVPESLIATLRRFQEASVILPDSINGRVAAEQLTISPRADPATHSFEVRLQLPVLDQPLYPGMSVKVAVTSNEAERLLAPESALVYRSEVAGVYVVDDQGIHFRQVRPGRRYGVGGREILAGLTAGERVALDPVRAAILLKGSETVPTHE
ncbi:MAG: efflux RND transporter periplasmic adaptor subunit [Gammaproteobacteria bacterium]